MKRKLIQKFLNAQVLLLSPICPHYCEAIWTKLLKNETTVLKALWPESGKVDEKLLEKHRYLQGLLYKLRLKLQFLEQKGNLADSLYLYVAADLPAWKKQVMEIMKSLYRKDTNDFAPTFRKDASALINKIANKKEAGRMMGFVGELADKVKTEGDKAIDFVVPFDEKEFLETQIDYIKAQLNLISVQVFSGEDEKAIDPEKKKQSAYPLEPSFTFSTRKNTSEQT